MESFLKLNRFVILENSDHFYLCHDKRFTMDGRMPFFKIDDMWALEIYIPFTEFLQQNVKITNY